MKRFIAVIRLLIVAVVLLIASASAQTTNVTASHITDLSRMPINGTFQVCPNQLFVMGGGGNVVNSCVTAAITSGYLPANFTVADTSLTTPVNVSYTVKILNRFSEVIATYPNFQPTGATYSFDSFVQAAPPYINAAYIQPIFSVNGVPTPIQDKMNFAGPGVSYGNGTITIVTGSTAFANITGQASVAQLPTGIPNANLLYSSTTVNGIACALGATCTIPTGAVTSVFGRTGAVSAISTDYSAFYDALGAASTAQTNAEAYSSNASNLTSGTVSAALIPTLNQNTTGNAATATQATSATNVSGGTVNATTGAFSTSLNVVDMTGYPPVSTFSVTTNNYMATGQSIGLHVGAALSSYDAAYCGFHNGSGNGSTANTALFGVYGGPPVTVDGLGNVFAPTSLNTPMYFGPAVAPSGTCTSTGAWEFSKDGHATVCLAGTWTTKI